MKAKTNIAECMNILSRGGVAYSLNLMCGFQAGCALG